MVKRVLGCATSTSSGGGETHETDHATPAVADPRVLRSRYHTVKTILYGFFNLLLLLLSSYLYVFHVWLHTLVWGLSYCMMISLYHMRIKAKENLGQFS